MPSWLYLTTVGGGGCMSSEPQADSAAAANKPQPDGGRRRTYNRRSDDSEISPPYFEAFERIAVALEHIEQVLRSRSVTLPDVENRARAEKT
jgi:hypothetical protein